MNNIVISWMVYVPQTIYTFNIVLYDSIIDIFPLFDIIISFISQKILIDKLNSCKLFYDFNIGNCIDFRKFIITIRIMYHFYVSIRFLFTTGIRIVLHWIWNIVFYFQHMIGFLHYKCYKHLQFPIANPRKNNTSFSYHDHLQNFNYNTYYHN